MAIITRLSGDPKVDAILRYIYTEINKVKSTTSSGTVDDITVSRLRTNLEELANRLSRLESAPAPVAITPVTPVNPNVPDTSIPFTHTYTNNANVYIGKLSIRTIYSYDLSLSPLVPVATVYETDTQFLEFFNTPPPAPTPNIPSPPVTVAPFTHTKTSNTSISLGKLSTRLVETFDLSLSPLVGVLTYYDTEAQFLEVFNG